jgi:hypothetical protein
VNRGKSGEAWSRDEADALRAVAGFGDPRFRLDRPFIREATVTAGTSDA